MTGQNTSSAVMQQRHETHDSLDDFPTPPFATRALCEWLLSKDHPLYLRIAREPCANRGYMVAPLEQHFARVEAADVHDYGVGYPVVDYLFGLLPAPVDWTIINPPFRLASQFVERALETSTHGVALFVRSAFLEGGTRHADLFSKNPPSAILQFSERVVIHRSAMRRKGQKYSDRDGVLRSASTATSYCWIVWEFDKIMDPDRIGPVVPEFHWIPPCCDQLEEPGDYAPRGNIDV
jgi:hypothetical protein